MPATSISDDLDMEATSTWDSLSHMELIAAIEDEFHIELSLDDIVGMTSMARIKAVLAARGSFALMELAGRGAIVAGGAGSLGRAIVAALRGKGVRVVVFDLTADPAPFDDDEVTYIPTDALDETVVAASVSAAVTAIGKISILVNATGAIHSEPLVNVLAAERRHKLASWDRIIGANLTATFLVTSHVAEHMAVTRTKGVIVNFSSVAAAGNAGQSAYAAAKAGIEALTAVWAKELGPIGIRTVAIAPGFIDTPSTLVAMPEAHVKEWARDTPLRRLGTAADIAGAVVFAIENDYLSGRTLAIDGGLTI